MLINFKPNYTITDEILSLLMEAESIKQRVHLLPMNLSVINSLRETAKLFTTHYSTFIEGNRLNVKEVKQVVEKKGHFPGRERDEKEIIGYYYALKFVEDSVTEDSVLNEDLIKKIHAHVISFGVKKKLKPTPYREAQNIIKDSSSGKIAYLPPEACDVPGLMADLVEWTLAHFECKPVPLIAAIIHYQFVTIHPYFDGNGRTARLLTNYILYKGGYDLKGLYSLEEYYAKNLRVYYEAISVGPSHNYYMGRAESDITKWIVFFLRGLVHSFKKVEAQMELSSLKDHPDHSIALRSLDPKQRKVLMLFEKNEFIRSKQLCSLFDIKSRTASGLCKKWVDSGFLKIKDSALKSRTYELSQKYSVLLSFNQN